MQNQSKVMDDMNQSQNQSVLNAFDFTAIDEMDPSLSEGHNVLYDRERWRHHRGRRGLRHEGHAVDGAAHRST